MLVLMKFTTMTTMIMIPQIVIVRKELTLRRLNPLETT